MIVRGRRKQSAVDKPIILKKKKKKKPEDFQSREHVKLYNLEFHFMQRQKISMSICLVRRWRWILSWPRRRRFGGG